jgi:hypothetical protein
MEIDGDVVALRPQAAAESEIAEQAAQAVRARRDDDLIQMGVAGDDRRRRGLDDIADGRVRKTLAQRMDGGGGEGDVTNLPEADEQNLDAVIPRWWLRR